MKAAYWQKGEALDFINDTKEKIEAGTVLVLGKRIGISGTDIEVGALGSVHVSGVYEFDKKDKEELAAGTEVYWTEDGITSAASSGEGNQASDNVVAGFVAVKSSSDSQKVLVKINA